MFAQRDFQPKEPKSCGCVSQINCSNNTFFQLLTKLRDFEPLLALRTNLQASYLAFTVFDHESSTRNTHKYFWLLQIRNQVSKYLLGDYLEIMSLFMRAKLLQTSQLTQPPNKLQTTAMLNNIQATFKKRYIDCSKIIE